MLGVVDGGGFSACVMGNEGCGSVRGIWRRRGSMHSWLGWGVLLGVYLVGCLWLSRGRALLASASTDRFYRLRHSFATQLESIMGLRACITSIHHC